MSDLTVAEKIDVLMQTMECVGSYPTRLRCIAHDCGFSMMETALLLFLTTRTHHKIKHSKQGYYIDEN